jgi:hypothetical protein
MQKQIINVIYKSKQIQLMTKKRIKKNLNLMSYKQFNFIFKYKIKHNFELNTKLNLRKQRRQFNHMLKNILRSNLIFELLKKATTNKKRWKIQTQIKQSLAFSLHQTLNIFFKI